MGKNKPKHNSDLEEEKVLKFRLFSVTVIENYINPSFSQENANNLRYTNGVSFELDFSQNLISTLTEFTLWLTKQDEQVKISEFNVDIVYKVLDLQSFIIEAEKGQYQLPDDVAAILARESLSNARGIHAYLIKGSSLDTYFIPYNDMSTFKQVYRKEVSKKL